MTIDEESRHQLYARLEQVLGPSEAATMMEYLPQISWTDLATKRDLDNHALATKRDLDNHAAATKRDLDNLAERMRTELAHHAAATDLKLEALEHRLEASITGQISQALSAQTRNIIISNASMLAGVAAIAAVLGR